MKDQAFWIVTVLLAVNAAVALLYVEHLIRQWRHNRRRWPRLD